LLSGKATSDDLERYVIGKLKISLGTQITNKVEGMLNDTALASEISRQFESYCATNPTKCEDLVATSKSNTTNRVELQVTVLTLGHWPTMPTLSDVKLPLTMQKCCEIFNEFYKMKFSAHKNIWVLSQGSVILKSIFSAGKNFSIDMAPLQAMVLMAFNPNTDVMRSPSGAISFNNLQQYTNISEDYLKRVLHSLSCLKHKILKKVSADGEEQTSKEKGPSLIRSTDYFVANDKFSNNLKQFKIPMATLVDSNETKAVEDSRIHAIEAAVVRTMKVCKLKS
jgi:cullin 1